MASRSPGDPAPPQAVAAVAAAEQELVRPVPVIRRFGSPNKHRRSLDTVLQSPRPGTFPSALSSPPRPPPHRRRTCVAGQDQGRAFEASEIATRKTARRSSLESYVFRRNWNNDIRTSTTSLRRSIIRDTWCDRIFAETAATIADARGGETRSAVAPVDSGVESRGPWADRKKRFLASIGQWQAWPPPLGGLTTQCSGSGEVYIPGGYTGRLSVPHLGNRRARTGIMDFPRKSTFKDNSGQAFQLPTFMFIQQFSSADMDKRESRGGGDRAPSVAIGSKAGESPAALNSANVRRTRRTSRHRHIRQPSREATVPTLPSHRSYSLGGRGPLTRRPVRKRPHGNDDAASELRDHIVILGNPLALSSKTNGMNRAETVANGSDDGAGPEMVCTQDGHNLRDGLIVQVVQPFAEAVSNGGRSATTVAPPIVSPVDVTTAVSTTTLGTRSRTDSAAAGGGISSRSAVADSEKLPSIGPAPHSSGSANERAIQAENTTQVDRRDGTHSVRQEHKGNVPVASAGFYSHLWNQASPAICTREGGEDVPSDHDPGSAKCPSGNENGAGKPIKGSTPGATKEGTGKIPACGSVGVANHGLSPMGNVVTEVGTVPSGDNILCEGPPPTVKAAFHSHLWGRPPSDTSCASDDAVIVGRSGPGKALRSYTQEKGKFYSNLWRGKSAVSTNGDVVRGKHATPLNHQTGFTGENSEQGAAHGCDRNLSLVSTRRGSILSRISAMEPRRSSAVRRPSGVFGNVTAGSYEDGRRSSVFGSKPRLSGNALPLEEHILRRRSGSHSFLSRDSFEAGARTTCRAFSFLNPLSALANDVIKEGGEAESDRSRVMENRSDLNLCNTDGGSDDSVTTEGCVYCGVVAGPGGDFDEKERKPSATQALRMS